MPRVKQKQINIVTEAEMLRHLEGLGVGSKRTIRRLRKTVLKRNVHWFKRDAQTAPVYYNPEKTVAAIKSYRMGYTA